MGANDILSIESRALSFAFSLNKLSKSQTVFDLIVLFLENSQKILEFFLHFFSAKRFEPMWFFL
jgi:hypothetical protein